MDDKLISELLSFSNKSTNIMYVVEKYERGHSNLSLRLTNTETENDFYLIFTQVEYFSGMLDWIGGEIHVAAENECLNIIRANHRFQEMEDDVIRAMRKYKLFEMGNEPYKTRIVAENVYRQETL